MQVAILVHDSTALQKCDSLSLPHHCPITARYPAFLMLQTGTRKTTGLASRASHLYVVTGFPQGTIPEIRSSRLRGLLDLRARCWLNQSSGEHKS
jgi:hypothetical protein